MSAEIDSKILERLKQWERTEGPLPRSLEFYRRLLSIQSAARLRIGAPGIHLSQEIANARTASGRPLLEFDDLSIDWPLAQEIFQEVSALFSSFSAGLTEEPTKLKDSAPSFDFLKEAARTWFEGAQLPLQMAAATDEAIREFIIPATLKPFLIVHQEALLSLVDQELWRHGYCPVCGGSADFAFLDREHGARWLMCSRCDAEWLFQRLECPYCGSKDQSALAYFTDDKGLYRLYVCEQCRRYLKAIDLRQAKDEVLLPLERFLTLDLDTQAQKKEYSPNGQTRKVEPSPNHRK